MKHLGVAVIAVALLAAACASDGSDGRGGTRALPPDDGAATSPSGEVIDPGDGIGDGSEPGDLPVVSPELASEIDEAMSDLSSRLGDDRLIGVTSAFELTWPDSSLGCPEPGVMYAQALVDGYRLELTDGDDVYVYHGEASGEPFLCASPS